MLTSERTVQGCRTRSSSLRGGSISSKELAFEGPKLVTVEAHHDERGSFAECWNISLYQEVGLPIHWPQDNISRSKRGVMRGMHFQHENPQGKLIQCVSGMIRDACVDLRPSSPDYQNWYTVDLRDDQPKMLYVPPGFAHGFLALTDAVVHYKCTTIYDPDSAYGLDPLRSGVDWEIPKDLNITLSEADRGRPSLVDYVKGRR